MVEGATIVASILLAFSIDAAWEMRQQSSRQEVALNGLRTDFIANRAALDRTREMHRQRAAFFPLFLESTPQALEKVPADSAANVFLLMYAPNTFDAILGNIDALIGAGNLGLISNHELKESLVNFKRFALDLAEEGERMWNSASDFLNFTIPMGGPWQGGVRSEAPPLTPEGLARIRSDQQAMGQARVCYHWSSLYLRDLNEISDMIDQITKLIDQELQ